MQDSSHAASRPGDRPIGHTSAASVVTSSEIHFTLKLLEALAPLSATGSSPADLKSQLDAIDAIIGQLYPPGKPTPTYHFGSPLHLTIPISSPAVLNHVITTHVLSHSPSIQPPLGHLWPATLSQPSQESPLHVASRLGLHSAVDALFRCPEIDDTQADAKGRWAEEVARGEEVRAVFQAHRTAHAALLTSTLHRYARSGNTPGILALFAKGRGSGYIERGWVDVNGVLDGGGEETVLHLAAKRDDLLLVEWVLASGGDPGVRDRKRRRPADLVPKGGRCKKVLPPAPEKPLAQSLLPTGLISRASRPSSHSTPAQSRPTSPPRNPAPMPTPTPILNNLPAALFTTPAPAPGGTGPTMRGTLSKYTNVAQGYKPRYFVVERGILSYYRTAQEYPVSCRGSVELSSTDIGVDTGGDRCRFWCVVKGKGGGGYHMRARSEVEAKKWVWTLMQAKRWALDTQASRDSLEHSNLRNTAVSATDGDADDLAEEELEKELERAGETLVGMGVKRHGLSASLGSIDSAEKSERDDGEANPRLSFSGGGEGETTNSRQLSPAGSPVASTKELQEQLSAPSVGLGARSGSQMSVASGLTPSPRQDNMLDRHPSHHPDDYAAFLSSLSLHLDVHARLIESILAKISEAEREDMQGMAEDSLAAVRHVAGTMARKAEEREKIWRKKWKMERESRKRWEEVVSNIVGGMTHEEGGTESEREQPSADAGIQLRVPNASSSGGAIDASSTSENTTVVASSVNTKGSSDADVKGRSSWEDDRMDDSDNEEEFFDAEEGNQRDVTRGSRSNAVIETIMGFSKMSEADLKGRSSTTSQSTSKRLGRSSFPREATRPASQLSEGVVPVIQNGNSSVVTTLPFVKEEELRESSIGYPDPSMYRKRLPLDPTKPKPTLNVWSFIKSAIGKDLTKVTLPVFFNEPLSLLQRLSEDLEYTQLLAVAGRIGRCAGCAPNPNPRDPNDPAEKMAAFLGLKMAELERLEGEEARLLRVMLVGGFGMSSYSSTVGRVGKPFNPLLGETFEVVRQDLGMRYIAEQVCHHPPISACYCDSTDYCFWTEVNVKSRFWGTSLEIHPLGFCHARLPVYGKPTSEKDTSLPVVDSEHYSWRKVSSCVHNLIYGSLWIDHTGDLTVHNHRTGDECTITFKPNKSSSKISEKLPGNCELTGEAKTGDGRLGFVLRGRWDGQLDASPVVMLKSEAFLRGPVTVFKKFPYPPDPTKANFFNFTKFAIELNDLPKTLAEYLPKSDCRFRPDQLRMERGEWDDSTVWKDIMENAQRFRRHQWIKDFETSFIVNAPPGREMEPKSIGEPYWRPRWFQRTIEPDTGEEHWLFTGQYWRHRQEASNGGTWPSYMIDPFVIPDEVAEKYGLQTSTK
ncbi:hypothetical protein M427DRAFT_51603 [Gonapodya prolifera JEL478]|uniref:PH domain-containing protein n=1 Tax=Gonapodya prolifera (strain JEL478) TaxID=1344416 RepID=A0A139AY59_GONPJ|nr:hypothetical protein M427DRAFT_51603 [Gonapodya prolifera JEL478]|eukprot:KXS21385.1 hypothetical protein M427DRAFT_51603 [Gonapodya prolifera JEL478]